MQPGQRRLVGPKQPRAAEVGFIAREMAGYGDDPDRRNASWAAFTDRLIGLVLWKRSKTPIDKLTSHELDRTGDVINRSPVDMAKTLLSPRLRTQSKFSVSKCAPRLVIGEAQCGGRNIDMVVTGTKR